MAEQQPDDARRRRSAEPDVRRQSILDAGLAVFAAQGFAAAKLEDVAARAGIAKGTIYLHFRDKQDLFEQIIRSAVAPLLEHFERIAEVPDLPIERILGQLFDVIRSDVLGTDRKLIVRLVLTEGHRFPQIAEVYHREVIAKASERIGGIIRRAVARGERVPPMLATFPHLLFAPALMLILWDGLFSKFAELDADALMQAHQDIVLGSWSKEGTIP